ncbi:hypothetical protein [Corynebacterium sp. 335C]
MTGPAPLPPQPGAPAGHDAVVRQRSGHVRVSAAIAAGLHLAAALLTWLSFRPVAGDPTSVLLARPLAELTGLLADAAAVVTLLLVCGVLAALERRALAHEPPPARGAAAVRRMHRVPVLNIPGPVTALAETGVRGPGRWAWFAACAAVAVAAVLRFTGPDSAAADLRAHVAAAGAALLLAAAAVALRAGLAPGAGRRIAVPGGPGARRDGDGEPAERPFWSRGLVDPAPARPRPGVVEPPLEDFVDDLIIRSDTAGGAGTPARPADAPAHAAARGTAPATADQETR